MFHDPLQSINTLFSVLEEELEADVLERVLCVLLERLHEEQEQQEEERAKERIEEERQEKVRQQREDRRRRFLTLRVGLSDEELQYALRASAEYAAQMRREEEELENEWLLEELAYLDLGEDDT